MGSIIDTVHQRWLGKQQPSVQHLCHLTSHAICRTRPGRDACGEQSTGKLQHQATSLQAQSLRPCAHASPSVPPELRPPQRGMAAIAAIYDEMGQLHRTPRIAAGRQFLLLVIMLAQQNSTAAAVQAAVAACCRVTDECSCVLPTSAACTS